MIGSSASRGRAFVLCTSNRRMNELYDLVSPHLDYNCYCQGNGLSRAELLDLFQNDTTGAVLFAACSFWKGVDIPSPAISLVIIDKLPFAPHRDSVVQYRQPAPLPSHREDCGCEEVFCRAVAPRQYYRFIEDEDKTRQNLSEDNKMKTYTFHVSLPGTGRAWRKIEMRADQTLEELHFVIQRAYEWDCDHLYSFFMSGKAWDESTEYRLHAINPDAPEGEYPRIVESVGEALEQYPDWE